MSLDINWKVVTEPAFLDALKKRINEYLSSLTSLDFVNGLYIEELSLPLESQNNPPEIEIEEITAPKPPFYLQGEEQLGPKDMQITVKLKYESKLKVSISGDIVLNIPAPQFIALPIKVTLTHIHIVGRAIIVKCNNDRTLVSLCRDEETLFDYDLDSEIGDPTKHCKYYHHKDESFILMI